VIFHGSHNKVPLKVSLFVWRLHHNRLLTKDNLMRRGILQPSSNKCVSVFGFVVWKKQLNIYVCIMIISQIYVAL